MNTRVTPVADFVRDRDLDFKALAVEQTIRKTVKSDEHFRDFTAAAEAVAGDAIAANIMMTGYAWQQGLIPLERESIEQAIRLNGVAVKANLAAFDWGRRLAAQPSSIDALERPETDRAAAPVLDEMDLEALITHRSQHLEAYQDLTLVERYATLVGRVRAAVVEHGLDEALPRAAAITYAKLLAYKDEYEVARLFSDPSFRAGLAAQFEGGYRISFNLAPPLLPGRAPNGRPAKYRFGRWMLLVFRLLARMKHLRGGPFDLFGWTAERKMERALICEYETLVDRVLAGLAPEKAGPAVELLALHQQVRGFGPVKEAAVEKIRARQAELLAAFEGSPSPQAIAAE